MVRKLLQCQCHHPQLGLEQQVWCLVMHLPVVVLLAETGSAKLGPRKVQAAAGHKPCLAHILLSKQLRPVCAEES